MTRCSEIRQMIGEAARNFTSIFCPERRRKYRRYLILQFDLDEASFVIAAEIFFSGCPCGSQTCSEDFPHAFEGSPVARYDQTLSEAGVE